MCDDEDDADWPVLDNDQVRELAAAALSLHAQAHPGGPAGVRTCRMQPCASLSLDVVSEVDRA